MNVPIVTLSAILLCVPLEAGGQSQKLANAGMSSHDLIWQQLCSVRRVPMNEQDPVYGSGQPPTESHVRASARAKITVQHSEAKPYDQSAGPALLEVHLTETFSGDIEGQSAVRALQVLRDDKSACLVSLQRFSGKLAGRQGTFVLQGSEVVAGGKIK